MWQKKTGEEGVDVRVSFSYSMNVLSEHNLSYQTVLDKNSTILHGLEQHLFHEQNRTGVHTTDREFYFSLLVRTQLEYWAKKPITTSLDRRLPRGHLQ